MSNHPTEDAEREAEIILSSFVPNVVCVPQEWDSRVDCMITLANGSVAGEMISLRELSEERLRATGVRLQMLSEGRDVSLVDEIRSPTRIVSPGRGSSSS